MSDRHSTRLLRLLSMPGAGAREVSQDVKHAFRLWTVRPWHTAFAIASLAIGIGANTGVFSVVNALLLRSLPFGAPERLATFVYFQPPHDSAAQLHDWRAQSAYLSDAALWEDTDLNLGGSGALERVHAAQTSWNFFATLGTQPVIGRSFLPGEDTAGRNTVAVIGYGLWQQLFAGDRRALGSMIHLNGTPLTVVGVAPPGFDYPRGAAVWKPAVFLPGNNGWEGVARLKPGISWMQARQAFDADVQRLGPRVRFANEKLRPALRSLQDGLAGPIRTGSLTLMACVALVLLIACTNVANLLMARTADRATELSVRSALGASRARLARQLLTECLLLSTVSAVLGMAVAFWTTSVAAQVQPPPLAVQSYSLLDGRVLAFALAASILCGLIFGLLPSLYIGRVHAFGARGSSTTRGSRMLREFLVGAQVMLTIVLLSASVSVGRGFVRLMGIDRGFDVKGVATVSVSLAGTTHDLAGRQVPYFEEALARLRRLPGVHSASATEFLPLYAVGFVGGPFGIDGHPGLRNATMIPVFSDYFGTMGGRILSGREINDEEVRSGARVAVVNEKFAAQFGRPADAVGRQLTIGRMQPWKIVGVVRGMNFATERDPSMVDGNEVFVPSHEPGGFFSSFVARVEGRAEDRLPAIRDAIRSVDPLVPVFGAKTMAQRLDDALARPKFYRTALLFFAGFALLLALIGIYGVVSYAVVQRSREMGVRLAVGTTPGSLRAMLVRQGLLTVAAGAFPGVVAARISGRFLESLVEGAKTIDPATSAGAVVFIGLTAAASIWLATRRIAALDIAAILRSE